MTKESGSNQNCFSGYPPIHKDGECCWCDHIRQLDKEGYYDFMKKEELIDEKWAYNTYSDGST